MVLSMIMAHSLLLLFMFPYGGSIDPFKAFPTEDA